MVLVPLIRENKIRHDVLYYGEEFHKWHSGCIIMVVVLHHFPAGGAG